MSDQGREAWIVRTATQLESVAFGDNEEEAWSNLALRFTVTSMETEAECIARLRARGWTCTRMVPADKWDRLVEAVRELGATTDEIVDGGSPEEGIGPTTRPTCQQCDEDVEECIVSCPGHIIREALREAGVEGKRG